jgi:hypothetical protein
MTGKPIITGSCRAAKKKPDIERLPNDFFYCVLAWKCFIINLQAEVHR